MTGGTVVTVTTGDKPAGIGDLFCIFGDSASTPATQDADDADVYTCVTPAVTFTQPRGVLLRLTDGSTFYSTPVEYYFVKVVALSGIVPTR